MTNKETIQIMALLSAFYGAGKGNPEMMAEGWHLILEPYPYEAAYRAVLNFAEQDTRDYATFPTVGSIVVAIKDEMAREEAPVKEIIRAISYGWGYEQMSADAKLNISREQYNEWLKMNAEEFAYKADSFAESIKAKRKQLKG